MRPRRPAPGPVAAARRWPWCPGKAPGGVVTAAHQQLDAPLILVWDNLNIHISAVMRTLPQPHHAWLTAVRLPARAPDLNPAEGAWSNMKNSLGNLGSAVCIWSNPAVPLQGPLKAEPPGRGVVYTYISAAARWASEGRTSVMTIKAREWVGAARFTG
jgi:DDE superfamily endonuclease